MDAKLVGRGGGLSIRPNRHHLGSASAAMQLASRVGFALALASALIAGCGVPTKVSFSPLELRSELLRRDPTLATTGLVVPFEVDADSIAIARRALANIQAPRDRVRALARALFDPHIFDLEYAPIMTADARNTLRLRRGNCMALASVFVGLARGLGFRAYYLDASRRLNDLDHQSSRLAVRTGHITAAVDLGSERVALDVAGDLWAMRDFKVLDDVEAVAHFFNNRGYERIADAETLRREPEWSLVANDFQMATRVFPQFGYAWNNVGIALTHLGRFDEAVVAFRNAATYSPGTAAPYNNLGALLAQRGDIRGAYEAYARAAELEPKSAHVHLNLARIMMRAHNANGALEEVEEALDLDPSYREALAVRAEISSYAMRAAEPAPRPRAAVPPELPKRKSKKALYSR